MPKGSDPRKAKYQDWIRGPGKKRAAQPGKGGDPARTVYNPNYNPASTIGGKTGAWDIEPGKQYKAGGNILAREKRQTFDEKLAAGNRADDPRNWEFHYNRSAGQGRYSDTKGMTGAERKTQAIRSARGQANKAAKLSGQSLYDIRKLEYKTQGIKDESKQATSDAKAGRRFGSTKAAKGVQAQRQLASRKSGRVGRQRAGSVGVFDAPSRSRRLM